jgi:hypothetical protein
MKNISILVLVLIGFLTIHWNSVQADDEGSFEEGKFLFLTFALFDNEFMNCHYACISIRLHYCLRINSKPNNSVSSSPLYHISFNTKRSFS